AGQRSRSSERSVSVVIVDLRSAWERSRIFERPLGGQGEPVAPIFPLGGESLVGGLRDAAASGRIGAWRGFHDRVGPTRVRQGAVEQDLQGRLEVVRNRWIIGPSPPQIRTPHHGEWLRGSRVPEIKPKLYLTLPGDAMADKNGICLPIEAAAS